MNNQVEKIKNKILTHKSELAEFEKRFKVQGSINPEERNNLDRLNFVISHYEKKLNAAMKNSAEGNSKSDLKGTIPQIKITSNDYVEKAKKLEANIQTFFS